MVPCRFSLNWPFLVFDPRLKARSPIYDAQPIGLLYFIGPYLHLGASSKVALKEARQFGRFLLCEMKWVFCHLEGTHIFFFIICMSSEDETGSKFWKIYSCARELKDSSSTSKRNCCSRSKIHTCSLCNMNVNGRIFGFLCSIAFMSIPLLPVFCDALAQICNVGKCVTDWFGAHLLGQWKDNLLFFHFFLIAICLRSFASFGSYTKFLLFWKPLSVISVFWPDVFWIFMAPIVDGCRAHSNHDDELLHKQCSFVAAECAPWSKTSTMITCIDNSDFYVL
jgi:hypothetical protein